MGKGVPGSGNSQAGGLASRGTPVFGGTETSSVRAAECWAKSKRVDPGKGPCLYPENYGKQYRSTAMLHFRP